MKQLLLATILLLSACASPGPGGAAADREYVAAVKKQTRTSDQYSGFYQTFQADVTLLSSSLQSAMVQRRAQFLQWDAKKSQQERDRAFQEMASTTKVFLRFFAPENDYDDLSKPNSIWKIYLEQGGTRYEGKARKMTDKLVEIMNLFPHHNRFSTAYEVVFNLPTNTAENSALSITLTSSLGTAKFDFK